MTGGSEISNELTLDVSDFTQGLERATKKLDSFNTKLDSLDTKSDKLEKDFKDLSTNANQAAKSMGAIGTAAKTADDALSALVRDAQKANKSFENMGDWTNHYGKSLDSLRPKMGAITKSTKEFHSVTAKMTAEEAQAVQAGIQSRAKDLHDEQRVISERIKARKQMISQLEQLERRAEISATYARADAYKVNAKGKEVPRYRGANIGRQRELEAEIATYQRQAQVIRQQKEHIAAIVGEMHYRNTEINKAIAGEHQLLKANQDQLAAQRTARQEAQKRAEEARNIAARTADAEKIAAKEVLATQRAAHKELMAMRREEFQMQKDMAALAAGAATVGATKAGVHQIAEYQNVDTRVKAINLSAAEEERFRQKAWDMSAQEKYLSRTDSMQTRLDALTAIGYNKEDTIDKTVGSAARNAYIMRSLGYEIAEFSDVVKNLYGFAEARQVMDDPNEVNRSFDIARRMGVASGGKIKMADVETVARNIGDLRQTMSAEGWVRLAAVMEQFKTAGGGNGGGGGVASVGTIFKMMSLYASGKPLTNGAAMDLLGADIMNESFANGTAQNFKNTREANTAFVKAVKYAGFKDTEAMSKDPIKFFTGIRGQLLDYMMQDSQFKKFFGAGAKKHSYDKDGKMIGANGQAVDQRKQDDIENAAFKRFFARMGLSNKAIDGMLLTTNRAFAERSYHAADTALNSKDEFQMMEDLSKNWNANVQELKASLADFAVTFEPLLRQLSFIPKAISDIVRGMSEFGKENPAIASLGLLTAGFVILKLAATAAMGPIGMLWRVLGTKKTLDLASAGAKALGSGLTTVTATAAAAATAMGSVNSSTDKAKDGMNKAGSAADDMGKKSKQGFLDLALGAAQGSSGVRGATGSIMRVLGLLLSWAGWLALAGMVGWAVGKWINDMKVGGLSIGEHTQNLMNSISFMWKDTFLAISEMLTKFFRFFGLKTDEQVQRIQDLRKQARQTHDDLEILTEEEQFNKGQEKNKRTNEDAKRILVGNLRKKVEEGGGTAEERQWYIAQTEYDRKFQNPHTRDQAVAPAAPKRLAASFAHLDKKYKVEKFTPKKTAEEEKTHNELPETFKPGLSSPTDQTGILAPKPKTGRERGDFVAQNAYDASLAALKEENYRDNARILELTGTPVDYNALAQAAFTKEWMTGKLDDGRDPSKRKFATRAYEKGKDWRETDIDWNNEQVRQWVALKSTNLKGDGIQKSLEFAAGKLGDATGRLDDALLDLVQDKDVNSSEVAKAKREFGKFEAKNPTTTTNNAVYDQMKLLSLAKLAGSNYATMAKDLKEQNEVLNDQLLENDTQATRNSEKRRIESETKKIKAVQDALDEQIANLLKNGNLEDKTYKELIKAKELGEKEFTAFLEKQNKLRVINTRSAYDQTMAHWRKLEDNINGVLSSYGERAGTDIWDVITGDQDLDIGGYLGGMAKDVGGSFFKNLWGQASKGLMGEGEGTSILDYFKNLKNGTQATSSSAVGRFLNGSRESGGLLDRTGNAMSWVGGVAKSALDKSGSVLSGMMGRSRENGGILAKTADGAKGLAGRAFGGLFGGAIERSKKTGGLLGSLFGGLGGEAKELTGDQAINANTSATSILTQAINNLATQMGFKNTPVALPSEQAPEGVPIIPFEHRTAIDPSTEPPEKVGIFSQISSVFTETIDKAKAGFSSLFNSGGEGGVFSKIKDGFSNLFSENSGLMSKIGGSFGSIFGGLGSVLGGLFGGSGSKVGGALSGALQGGASGGWMGALAGGVSALFANGGAFGSSGQVHAFANGGAFTNEVYNSPTLFKFANGGQFGVMGEAGPEAVMPLQRDSSGRLGVAVNGGQMGGDTTAVSIEINVTNNGDSSSESSTPNSSDWNQLAQKVKALVQTEIVQQKRPGGMLRNTN